MHTRAILSATVTRMRLPPCARIDCARPPLAARSFGHSRCSFGIRGAAGSLLPSVCGSAVSHTPPFLRNKCMYAPRRRRTRRRLRALRDLLSIYASTTNSDDVASTCTDVLFFHLFIFIFLLQNRRRGDDAPFSFPVQPSTCCRFFFIAFSHRDPRVRPRFQPGDGDRVTGFCRITADSVDYY